MSVLDAAKQLMDAGRRTEAIALVEAAAARDEPEAVFALANWRLFGLMGRQDFAEAMRLFARGAALGDVEATRNWAILIGNGTGMAADPERGRKMMATIAAHDPAAAAQLALLDLMAHPLAGTIAEPPVAGELLADRPLVLLHRGLLSPAECTYLMQVAEPMLRPSFVVNPTTGGRMADPIRTSWSMSLGLTLEDLVVHQLNRRFAAVTGTAVTCGEPLHILRYQGGQEYRPHTDSMPGEANQREWTVLVYLNDGYAGGETHFPRAGLKVRGQPGDALVFRNVDADGHLDLRTLHAGLPVHSGVKWLATRWIRARPVQTGGAA